MFPKALIVEDTRCTIYLLLENWKPFFTLKTYQMFITTLEKFDNGTITGQFRFVWAKLRQRNQMVIVMSWFSKRSAFKLFSRNAKSTFSNCSAVYKKLSWWIRFLRRTVDGARRTKINVHFYGYCILTGLGCQNTGQLVTYTDVKCLTRFSFDLFSNDTSHNCSRCQNRHKVWLLVLSSFAVWK